MSSLTNVNNNASVVVVGRTAPVPPGQQPASKSIPVVLASDQPAIPVVEQNKIASEVALSLLGIPRSEVALGIFADVNTYDVNPTEWSSTPAIREDLPPSSDLLYTGFDGDQGYGVKHIPEESGALVEAPADKFAVLTSKRFFRYQPGRVSAATFGVKTSTIGTEPNSERRNPVIRKYGIFDNFDGYYWETRDHGSGDQLVVVRRTQSLVNENPRSFITQQVEDYGIAGEPPSSQNANGTSGDLVIYRDGLIMVHAAMYDPSLLKEEVDSAISSISSDRITLSTSDDEYFNGQYISYHTEESSVITGLTRGKIYKVINKQGPAGGEYTIQLSELGLQGEGNTPISLGSLSGTHILRSPTPFIFPENSTSGAQDVMFPYQRSFGVNPATGEYQAIDPAVGFIDTAASPANIETQIDTVNNRWSDWVLHNVKPEFYKVYEYRVPRSRFSGDFLSGVQSAPNDPTNEVYYSDVVRTGSGDDTIKRPGQNVIDDATGGNIVTDSIWNIDFNKVIMQKIEFSWYGAVGALFLAYVPVSNGEARWVRVHHLRASNQLKVSSLGNATLPITYLVYGGGSENRYGYVNSSRLQNSVPGSGSYSEYITKYGASYYIDGGDRGTVRLYSYSSPSATDVKGSKYRVLANASQAQSADPYITLNESPPYDNNPTVSDFYMGGTVITNSVVDQGVKVTWVDVNSSPKRLYLNKALSTTNSGERMDILVDRPQIVYGVQTKTEIVSSQGKRVRNRVQVYPTRLTTGAAGDSTVSVQLIKNPIFQTFDSYTGDVVLNEDTVIQPAGQPTLIPTTAGSEPDAIAIGDSVYGWFRGYLSSDISQKKFSVLGLLSRTSSGFYNFTANDAYRGEVKITGTFLVAENYDDDGSVATTAPTTSELARLSSILINNEIRTPIPGTGTQVTTFYVNDGGDIFDLAAYFDYNKDYLSYPLTNETDALFIASTSVDNNTALDGNGNPTGSPIVRSSVLSSLTWEEQ